MRAGVLLIGVALALALVEGFEWSLAALAVLAAGLVLVIVAPSPAVVRRYTEQGGARDERR